MDPKTRSEVLAWAPRKIGGGVVVVELTPEVIEDAWDTAKRWWASLRGVEREAVAVGGSGRYTMPDDCEMVYEVFFSGESLGLTNIEPFVMLDIDSIPVGMLSMPGSAFYSTLAIYLQRQEMGQRIMSSDPSWDWDQDSGTLLVYPTEQTGAIIARYISTEVRDVDPTPPATTPRNDLRRMRNRDRDILLRYFIAECKEILARVRGKYTSGLPSAGGMVTMDADMMRGEAAEEKQALKEELLALSDTPMMLIG